ncbi:MAG: hypothetical protein QXY62_00860 [Candidatus Altiarchaeota archaeon]
MTIASYYVIESLVALLESSMTSSKYSEEIKKCLETFEKLTYRYSEDIELNKIFDNFKIAIIKKDFIRVESVKSALKELGNLRRLTENHSIMPPLR